MSAKQICLNSAVLDFMEERMDHESRVLEFGSGWSTLWFAQKCGWLCSVETSPLWWRTITDALRERHTQLDWVVELVVQPDEIKVRDSSVDFVLIDCVGHLRTASTKVGWSKLVPGGWLLLDDAQRIQYRDNVAWLTAQAGEPVRLGWDSERDVPTAKLRETLAWQKYSS